jgi:hypothetical protein
MVDPAAHRKWNVQLGLGIKLPTGDYIWDHFHKTDSTCVLGPLISLFSWAMAVLDLPRSTHFKLPIIFRHVAISIISSIQESKTELQPHAEARLLHLPLHTEVM